MLTSNIMAASLLPTSCNQVAKGTQNAELHHVGSPWLNSMLPHVFSRYVDHRLNVPDASPSIIPELSREICNTAPVLANWVARPCGNNMLLKCNGAQELDAMILTIFNKRTY